MSGNSEGHIAESRVLVSYGANWDANPAYSWAAWDLYGTIIDLNAFFATLPPLIGTIDGMTGDQNFLAGWACVPGLADSIQVHLYVGGPAGLGDIAAIAVANAASEPAVAAACQSYGTNYRFAIPLTDDLKSRLGGQALYVHGISTVGGANNLINNSGAFYMPSGTGVSQTCAAEGQFCAFSGSSTIRYGANGQYVTRTLANGTACSNDVFGDPIPGVVKSCAIVNGNSAATVIQREGFFMVASSGGIFYSNGNDAYCSYSSWNDWILSGGHGDLSNVRRRSELPGRMINGGGCGVPPQPEGLFPGPGGLYYSNGQDAFCHIQSWNSDLSNVRSRSDLPSRMRNDGDCG